MDDHVHHQYPIASVSDSIYNINVEINLCLTINGLPFKVVFAVKLKSL